MITVLSPAQPQHPPPHRNAAGTLSVYAATGDVDSAAPFAAGGAVGLTYLGFLGKYVDVIGQQGGASGAGRRHRSLCTACSGWLPVVFLPRRRGGSMSARAS